ncbi:MAG: hypothetical protein U0X20_08775 [Caldilineaceae bacterium]
MDMQRTAYLLVGSAKRGEESTSAALGGYLLDQLSSRGLVTSSAAVHRALRTPERTREMLAAVDRASVVLLSFPLYVDTTPYLVTQALEAIAAHRAATPDAVDAPLFAAICNCGFPEAHHCSLALEICAQFARQSRLRWAGGLALGAGGAIHGERPRPNGMTHNVAAALDQAAIALATGEEIPAASIGAMAQPMMPNGLYVMMGNLGWHMTARANKAWLRLGARPLAQERR